MQETHELVDYSENLKGLMKSEHSNKNKEQFEQYFTSRETALYMARLVKPLRRKSLKILDPGAGIGILGVALLNIILNEWKIKPKNIEIIAYEIDETLNESIKKNYNYSRKKLKESGIKFKYKIINKNFMEEGYKNSAVDIVIQNPPYKKIDSNSNIKKHLIDQHITASNQYAAFVLIAMNLLKARGSLVAITPRSFCNGKYFKEFRVSLSELGTFEALHLYESRKSLFRDDYVLQENIVFRLTKKLSNNQDKVAIYHSHDELMDDVKKYEIDYAELIHPDDPEKIIRILKNDRDKDIVKKIRKFNNNLEDLNLSVSTGPFVDFREEDKLKSIDKIQNISPYIFPEHFNLVKKSINWPIKTVKKFNYVIVGEKNFTKLRPSGTYVLVKRVSAKEEQRRIIATVIEGNNELNLKEYEYLAFDNKINYFHIDKKGIDDKLAYGLCLYLNSTLVDLYFRLFSGHTQVNVADLKNLIYPSSEQLSTLGEKYNYGETSQENIDLWISNL